MRAGVKRITRNGRILRGIDGCRGGWVVASAETSLATLTFELAERVESVFSVNAVVAIDIPIGLPDAGPRACDIAARKLLGPGQGSRVFPAPCRATLDGGSYAECTELNRMASGKKISKQTYGIIAKILEVDRAITTALQQRIREAHPEGCFRVLNGAPLQHSKKTSAGQRERLELLAANGLRFDPAAERQRLGRARVQLEDIIDAAACLLTAKRVAEHRECTLGDGAVDSRGLRMEIVV
jgi:predicted RNase H-like nuclease